MSNAINITRANYEEYFLLYIDKELSSNQMAEVEAFIESNPDLKSELEALQKTILEIDSEVEFKGKDNLFRTASPLINHDNYLEAYTLYYDHELTEAEKAEVETFVAVNPSVRKDFELHASLKLTDAEEMVYPDKQSLYRKEEKDRVIPMFWIRSAAAVLIGVALWTITNYALKSRNTTPQQVAHATLAIEKKNTVVPVTSQSADPATQVAVVNDATHTTEPASEVSEQVKERRTEQKNTDASIAGSQKVNTTVKKVETPVENVRPSNNLPEPEVAFNDRVINTGTPATNTVTNASNPAVIPAVNNSETTEITQAKYYTDDNTGKQDYAFYNVPQDEFHRTKLGSLLKKTSRTLIRNLGLNKKERNNND